MIKGQPKKAIMESVIWMSLGAVSLILARRAGRAQGPA